MEWVPITAETVRTHLAVELEKAYDAWILAYPAKQGRLEELTNQVRTEFRDAIASVSRNTLHSDPTYLPQSAARYCENLIKFELCMEMGVKITSEGRSIMVNAQMYLRQIPYGNYKFTDSETNIRGGPSFSVPTSSGRALGPLVSIALGFLFFTANLAHGAWVQQNETDYIPLNYDITEQSLGGHLAGIDRAIGFLSDTNGLYGQLVAIPAQVAYINSLLSELESHYTPRLIMDIAPHEEGSEEFDECIAFEASEKGLKLNSLAVNGFYFDNIEYSEHGGYTFTTNPAYIELQSERIYHWSDLPFVGTNYDSLTLSNETIHAWKELPFMPGPRGDEVGFVNITGHRYISFSLPFAELALGSQIITCWGDLTNGVNSRIATHESLTDNPHSVTAAQVGAPTVDNLIAVSNQFAQYLPTSGGGVITGDLRVVKAGFGRFAHGSTDTVATGAYSSAGGESSTATAQDAYADGYHATASGFASRAHGGWTEATAEYAEAGGRWARASNKVSYVWQGVNVANQYYGSHGDGTFNINPVGGIDGAYIGDTKLPDHIRRVSGTEWPETCTLYWPSNPVMQYSGTSSNDLYIYWVPTNFPTRRLHIIATDQAVTNVMISTPTNWIPDREVVVHISCNRTSAGVGSRCFAFGIGGNAIWSSTTYNSRREEVLRWLPDMQMWHDESFSPSGLYSYGPDGANKLFAYASINPNLPATVEAWMALRTNAATRLLAVSPQELPDGFSPAEGQEDEVNSEDPDEEETR